MAASGAYFATGGSTSDVEDALGQLREVIDELTAASAETEFLDRLRAARSRLESSLTGAHSDAAAAVRAMSKRVDTKIEDASRDAELERAKEELTAATREAGRLQAEVSALRGDKAIAEDRLAEVERSVEKVAARLEAARACQDVDVNQLAHKLGLYMTVCPIKWDLDAPEGVLRGLIAPPAGQGVPAAFEKDVRGMAATEVADELWAAVDAACDA